MNPVPLSIFTWNCFHELLFISSLSIIRSLTLLMLVLFVGVGSCKIHRVSYLIGAPHIQYMCECIWRFHYTLLIFLSLCLLSASLNPFIWEKGKRKINKKNYSAIIMCWHFGRVYIDFFSTISVDFIKSNRRLSRLPIVHTLIHKCIYICISWLCTLLLLATLLPLSIVVK